MTVAAQRRRLPDASAADDIGGACVELAACARLAQAHFANAVATIRLFDGAKAWLSGKDGGFEAQVIALNPSPEPQWDANAGTACAPVRLDDGQIVGDICL